jgi:hypothetical protein
MSQAREMMIPCAASIGWSIVLSAAVGQTFVGNAPGPGFQATHPEDIAKAKLLGVLMDTPLTLQLEYVPAREAFRSFGDTLGITLYGRYSDDSVGHGIDPAIPLTVVAEGRPALDVLEDMLEQCEVYEDCTWQVRHGAIEVGSKRRLAAPAARETRTYDLRDLLIEAPAFPSGPDGGGRFMPCDSPYVDALLGEKTRRAVRGGRHVERKLPRDLLLEIIELMIETIEPGHWDIGGKDKYIEEDADAAQPPSTSDRPKRRLGALRDPNIWASIRAKENCVLIIAAPDFMHRAIGGYPQPIRPADKAEAPSEQHEPAPQPPPHAPADSAKP